DRELHGRDIADRADDAALGSRPARARRAAVRTREDQRDPAGHHRRVDGPMGHKVSIVEVKDVEIPSSMQRAMARQAEAERERRAKIINAEGEFQASERLKDAALVIEEHPTALQLRYLQTLLELGSSQSTTIVFPAPIDLIRPFIEKADSKS